MVQLGIIRNSIVLLLAVLLLSCIDKKQTNMEINIVSAKIDVPKFNVDSAYLYIQKQVDFGPRVPNTIEHEKCANYLARTLERFGASVIVQEAFVNRYDGVNMNMKNIIGSFNPESYKRILLCAHWDTRFLADNDTVEVTKPIMGANDGGSGVGVLLEIARQIQISPLEIGIDIIFFDVEDQGQPNGEFNKSSSDSWCLGSQYWAKNPHETNYFADYGILLDMVAGENARFTREGVSEKFASRIVDKVWQMGRKIGFSNFFVDEKTPGIIDDHLYINSIIHIPTINIVEYDNTTHNKFNKHHHKHSDNMSIIDKTTLHAVGQTVLGVLYNE